MEATDMNISDQKDIIEMKGDIKSMQEDIRDLKSITSRHEHELVSHDKQIAAINTKLNDIYDNTTWIKRTVTGAIISAICTALIGGCIAIIFAVFQK